MDLLRLCVNGIWHTFNHTEVPAELFTHPQCDRLKDFLSKVL